MAIHGMLQKLFRMCFDTRFVEERVAEVRQARGAQDNQAQVEGGPQDAGNVADDDSADDGDLNADQLQGEQDKYRQELGNRKARGVRVMRGPDTPLSVMLATLTLGPLHYAITHQLNTARLGNEKAGDSDCPIPIVDIVNPARSFITIITQYYSYMMLTPAMVSHLRVLSGYFDLGMVPRKIMKEILRIIAGAAVSLFYRFIDRILRKMPWLLFKTIDERLSDAEREAPAKQAASSHFCCVDDSATESMLRQIALERGEEAGSLDWSHIFEDSWPVLLAQTAKEIDGGISDLEDRNARNKNQAESGQTTEMLCAKYTLAEAKAVKASYHKTPQESAPPAAFRGGRSSNSSRQHATQLFHTQRCKTLAEHGISVNPATGAAWAVAAQDWNVMTDEEVRLWECRAELANSGAMNPESGQVVSPCNPSDT
jgi:hypothetical protein